MREIKFRAWDIANEEMLTVDILQLIDPDGEPWVGFTTESGGNGVIPLCKTVLMQFTGLLDRHGKEIYEGDILKWSSFRQTIRWGHSNWRGIENAKKAEIVGNIYEAAK